MKLPLTFPFTAENIQDALGLFVRATSQEVNGRTYFSARDSIWRISTPIEGPGSTLWLTLILPVTITVFYGWNYARILSRKP